jgi:hypothetical protein
MNRPTFPALRALLPMTAVALLVVAACAPTAAPGWTFAPLGPTPPPAPTPATPAPGETPDAPSCDVIELELTSDLRILRDGQQVAEIRVQAGQDYVFRVDNTAGYIHNIYLGPPERLLANDTAGLPGLDEWESGVREFSWTATSDAQSWQFACTVPGHYAPMHGELVIEE